MTTRLPRPEAIIFDLDGTLFKAESLFVDAFHLAANKLREEGLYEGPTPPDNILLGSLGLLLEQIWQNVLPNSSHRARLRLNELVLSGQMQALSEGKGELYAGVREALQQLHNRGFRLFVASNGLEIYVKRIAAHMEIAHLFTALYSAGEYQTASKNDLVRLLLDTHNVSSAWMVGDRSSDVAAGKANGLPVIGCGYAGFGHADELAAADATIAEFSQLCALLPPD